MKISWEKKIREIFLWETRTRIENATMRQNHIFYVFLIGKTYSTLWWSSFYFLFFGAPSKISTFEKVSFPSLRTMGKCDFFESTHFQWRAIEKVHFLKSNHFHGFTLSGCSENISKLCKNNHVGMFSRNTFPFHSQLFIFLS